MRLRQSISRRLRSALTLLAIAALAVAAGSPPGAPQAGLQRGRVLLENDHVVVVEGTIGPGEVTGMHTHELPAVVVCIEGSTLKETLPDGTTRNVTRTPGEVVWRDKSFRHDETNTGEKTLRVIAVQMKK